MSDISIISVVIGAVVIVWLLLSFSARTRTRRKAKQHMEFGQKMVVVSWAVTIAWISLSFLLAFFDKATNESLSSVLATGSFMDTVGYFAYQGYLKNSRNKHSVDAQGVPYKAKAAVERLTGETDDTAQ